MIKKCLALTLALLMLSCLAAGEVTTALSGLVDIGGQSRFILPSGLAQTPDGALVIVDGGNHCVLRWTEADGCSQLAGALVSPNVLGQAMRGYLDTAVLESLFSSPVDAAFLASGRLIVSDGGNNVLRVLADGRMYTFSGTGEAGYRNGDKREAQFSMPGGLAIDAYDTVYVADTLNHCIRATDAGGAARLLCGQPGVSGYRDGALSEALFCEPVGIALSPDGALYVADSGNQCIRKIAGGQVTTVAGAVARKDGDVYAEGGFADGAALAARLNFPTGVCLDASGTLYIADTGNHAVRTLSQDGMLITLAGTGEAGYLDGENASAQFNRPTDVYIIDGTLFVADSLNRAVRAVSLGQ